MCIILCVCVCFIQKRSWTYPLSCENVWICQMVVLPCYSTVFRDGFQLPKTGGVSASVGGWAWLGAFRSGWMDRNCQKNKVGHMEPQVFPLTGCTTPGPHLRIHLPWSAIFMALKACSWLRAEGLQPWDDIQTESVMTQVWGIPQVCSTILPGTPLTTIPVVPHKAVAEVSG